MKSELPPEARGPYQLGLITCTLLGVVSVFVAAHILGVADLIAYVLPGPPGLWVALAGVALGVLGWREQRR